MSSLVAKGKEEALLNKANISGTRKSVLGWRFDKEEAASGLVS